MKTLSSGAKTRALYQASKRKAQALLPIGHPRGYRFEVERDEELEIAELLERAGQPHAGRRNKGRALHCIDVMNQSGLTERQAARWVLACGEWAEAFEAAVTAKARDLQVELIAEFDAGLKKRAGAIPIKAAQRLEAQIKKTRQRALAGGLHVEIREGKLDLEPLD